MNATSARRRVLTSGNEVRTFIAGGPSCRRCSRRRRPHDFRRSTPFLPIAPRTLPERDSQPARELRRIAGHPIPLSSFRPGLRSHRARVRLPQTICDNACKTRLFPKPRKINCLQNRAPARCLSCRPEFRRSGYVDCSTSCAGIAGAAPICTSHCRLADRRRRACRRDAGGPQRRSERVPVGTASSAGALQGLS